MKVVICGDRTVSESDFKLIDNAVKGSKFKITEVVSGCAKGADRLGERWANYNKIPIKKFKAEWDNLDAPGAIVKEGQYGKYNAKAGFDRNQLMAEYADGVIVLDPNNENENGDIIERATKKSLPIFKYPQGIVCKSVVYKF